MLPKDDERARRLPSRPWPRTRPAAHGRTDDGAMGVARRKYENKLVHDWSMDLISQLATLAEHSDLQVFREGERGDSNPRPPGPQPGERGQRPAHTAAAGELDLFGAARILGALRPPV